jgi:carboxypeptidase family protein
MRHQPDTTCEMKQIYFRVIAYTLSVVLLYPAFAVSQTSTGSLSGIVIDVLGIAIPKTKVWATRKSDQGVRFETITGDSGTFSFTNLPPDVYEVTVFREDTDSTSKQVVSVSSGRMAQLQIQFSGCDNVPKGKDDVSDQDKAEVLRATFVQGVRQWGLLDQKQFETSIIKVRRQCIVVSLSNTLAKGKRSKSFEMSGVTLIYEYRKESGKWVGKIVASGIS